MEAWFLETLGKVDISDTHKMIIFLVASIAYAIFNEVRRNRTVTDRNSKIGSISLELTSVKSSLDAEIKILKNDLSQAEEKLIEKEELHLIEIMNLQKTHERHIDSIIKVLSYKTDLVMLQRDAFEASRRTATIDTLTSIRNTIKGKFKTMKYDMMYIFRQDMMKRLGSIDCLTGEGGVCSNKTIVNDSQLKGYESLLIESIAEGEELCHAIVEDFKDDLAPAAFDQWCSEANRLIHHIVWDGMLLKIPSSSNMAPNINMITEKYTISYFTSIMESVKQIRKNEKAAIEKAKDRYEFEVKKIYGDRRSAQ